MLTFVDASAVNDKVIVMVRAHIVQYSVEMGLCVRKLCGYILYILVSGHRGTQRESGNGTGSYVDVCTIKILPSSLTYVLMQRKPHINDVFTALQFAEDELQRYTDILVAATNRLKSWSNSDIWVGKQF